MISFKKSFLFIIALLTSQPFLSAFLNAPQIHARHLKFPYKAAGLSEWAAAAHLLSRFTFGATPGQIDAVVHEGLEHWFQDQLKASLPDPYMDSLLNKYDALRLTNEEVVDIFPTGGREVRMAVKDGIINKDSVGREVNKKAYNEILDAYMKTKRLRPQQELYKQFTSQKILRAAYSQNQLQEVMTSFWFNHFNVAIVKNDCAEFIPAYERDVIRPNALGNFGDLLLHTAQSPAMLYYLDNFSSSVAADTSKLHLKGNPAKPQQLQGLNENYAREVMELHTLGVDGGYTQNDVTQAARVFTGWTVYPLGHFYNRDNNKEQITKDSSRTKGYVHNGDFLFNPRQHDTGNKIVLDRVFSGDSGYEEGVQLLDMLAHHPSTAAFICREIAIRFVSDTPAVSLVNKMTQTFIKKNGDIKELLITMVSSPEFWASSAIKKKIKSPFELAISSVRSLNAHIDDPAPLNNWISKMGEHMYNYQAPTGFPDRGQYWINTGSLLDRMNFGLAFASGRVQGISLNLLALSNNHEPESAAAALRIFGKKMVPLGDSLQMEKRLSPLLNDPALSQKVSAAAAKNPAMNENADSLRKLSESLALQRLKQSNIMLSQVVGVLIGSPEFQRR